MDAPWRFTRGGKDAMPLTIQELTQIRKNQLSLWHQKKLPQTELVRRQEAILGAGHFEAYNYWLFRGARVDEFNEWSKEHQVQYQAWMDWQAKNRFSVQAPDFQRLHFLRKSQASSASQRECRVHSLEAVRRGSVVP
jgi:hypothetical protein